MVRGDSKERQFVAAETLVGRQRPPAAWPLPGLDLLLHVLRN